MGYSRLFETAKVPIQTVLADPQPASRADPFPIPPRRILYHCEAKGQHKMVTGTGLPSTNLPGTRFRTGPILVVCVLTCVVLRSKM